MFTGIIEELGRIKDVEVIGSNIKFTISAPFAGELKINQSVAHDGCCLTVVNVSEETYEVMVVEETQKKTGLKSWKVGKEVNLERCLPVSGRYDGHIVQGHVDHVAKLESILDKNGSYFLTFSYESGDGFITVPQGSISVNGISLTVAESSECKFSVAIIPYTWEHTNLKNLEVGSMVNIEFDIIGKYVSRLISK